MFLVQVYGSKFRKFCTEKRPTRWEGRGLRWLKLNLRSLSTAPKRNSWRILGRNCYAFPDSSLNEKQEKLQKERIEETEEENLEESWRNSWTNPRMISWKNHGNSRKNFRGNSRWDSWRNLIGNFIKKFRKNLGILLEETPEQLPQ